MRLRRLLAVMVLLLTAAAAVVGWISWRGRSASQAQQVGVTLLVNLRARAEVTPGTPLVFEVSVTSSPSSGALTVGSRWRPWHRLIHLEEMNSRAPLSWTMTSASPPRSVSMVRNSDGRPEMRNETSAVAHLEAGRHVHIMTESAAPEGTVNIPPGTYRVRAVLETPFWMFWGWRGRVASAPVTIAVVDPSKTGNRRNALETQRLLRAGDFYIGVERFVEAERAAREVVTSEPKHVEAHILLGDALVGLNRWQEALTTYYRALALVPPSYEQPTLFYNRIESVVHRGGAKKEPAR